MENSKKKRPEFLKGQSEFTQLPTKFVYMNNGTEGSMPISVIKAINKNLKKWANNPTTSYETDLALGNGRRRTGRQWRSFWGCN